MSRHHGSDRTGASHPLRGTLVAVLAVPVIAVGGLMVLGAIVALVRSGLDPRAWLSPSAADWLWGTGIAGDAGSFVRFMLGTLLTTGGVAAIRWGFHGREP